MKKILKTLFATTLLTVTAGGITLSLHQEAVAQGYDIDCKVILCLAGGFPKGCANAKSYMIDRITSVPPKPPFGFCAFSNGDEYDDYEAPFSFLGGRNSYLCAEGSNLFFEESFSGRFQQQSDVFCYDEQIAPTFSFGNGRFNEFNQTSRASFSGVSEPIRVNYRIQITIQPGSTTEFRSPVFFGNTGTGFITQRPS